MLLAQALQRLRYFEEDSDRRNVLVQNLKLSEKLAKTHLRIEFPNRVERVVKSLDLFKTH